MTLWRAAGEGVVVVVVVVVVETRSFVADVVKCRSEELTSC